MKKSHSTHDGKSRSHWGIGLLVWAAIAALSFGVAPNWHDLLAEPGQAPQSRSSTEIPAAASATVDDTSVPAASSVFTGRSYPVEEHVQAF